MKISKRKRIFITILLSFIFFIPQLISIPGKKDFEISKKHTQSNDMKNTIKNFAWLIDNDFIKKENKKYTIVKAEDLNYKQVKQLENNDNVSYDIEDCLSKNQKIINNTYRDVSDVDKILFYYVMSFKDMNPIENNIKLNERLKSHHKLLNDIEKHGDFYRSPLFFILEILGLNSLAFLLFVCACCEIEDYFSYYSTDAFNNPYLIDAFDDFNWIMFYVLIVVENILSYILPLKLFYISIPIYFISLILIQKEYIEFDFKMPVFSNKHLMANKFERNLE